MPNPVPALLASAAAHRPQPNCSQVSSRPQSSRAPCRSSTAAHGLLTRAGSSRIFIQPSMSLPRTRGTASRAACESRPSSFVRIGTAAPGLTPCTAALCLTHTAPLPMPQGDGRGDYTGRFIGFARRRHSDFLWRRGRCEVLPRPVCAAREAPSGCGGAGAKVLL